jgi:hypothetical protein
MRGALEVIGLLFAAGVVVFAGCLAVTALARWWVAGGVDWDADDRDPEQVDQHGEGR